MTTFQAFSAALTSSACPICRSTTRVRGQPGWCG
jgi:hypothetical protein